MPTRLLSGPALWKTIHRLARQCKARKLVATAYLGRGSAKALHLKRGDVLLCGLSLQNVKRGAVCAPDLLPLRNRGVGVYGIESLHAKIYLFGRTAIIGSPNLSRTSQRLEEAAVLTTDPDVVGQVREWFIARCMSDPVEAKVLENLATAYRPPKGNPLMALEADGATDKLTSRKAAELAASSPAKWSRGKGQILWYVPKLEVFDPEGEAEKASKSDQLAAKRIDPSLRDSRIDQLHVTLDSIADQRLAAHARRGDLLVTATRSGNGWSVEQTGTILVVRRHGKAVGTIVTYVLSSNRVAAPQTRFLRALAARGVSLGYRGTRTIAISDPAKIRCIVELASGKGLRALRSMQ